MAITLSTEEMIGVIAGSVVGGIVILLIFGVIVYCCCCRSRRKNRDKAPASIRENRSNGHINRPLPVAKLSLTPKPSDEDPEIGRAVGYAYPIVGGRPVSYPYFGSSNIPRPNPSPPSSSGTKSSNPVKRQPSQALPPNAYRLPGLADKSFSMSDNNLTSLGTINPAYDPTGDKESPQRNVYRTQSLINVDRPDYGRIDRLERNNNQSVPSSTVYQYDGSLGRVTSRPQDKNNSQPPSNAKEVFRRLESCHEEAIEGNSPRHSAPPGPPKEADKPSSNLRFRTAHELETADMIHAVPSKYKKSKAPEAPSAPVKGLPRIPLNSPTEASATAKSSDIDPKSATRRSLTSEMSYRAKGHQVTDEAFDFLEHYNDDGRKS